MNTAPPRRRFAGAAAKVALIGAATVCGIQLPYSRAGGEEVDSQQTLQRQISRWAELLDAHKFRDRSSAMSGLQRAGQTALPTLQQVIAVGSHEASTRAFDVLQAHLSSKDAQLASASLDVLLGIARQTDHPQSRSAGYLVDRHRRRTTGSGVIRLPPARETMPARFTPPTSEIPPRLPRENLRRIEQQQRLHKLKLQLQAVPQQRR